MGIINMRKPDEPIESIEIDTECVGFDTFRMALTVYTCKRLDSDFFYALFKWAQEMKFLDGYGSAAPTKVIFNDPAPTKVIFNDPATIVFWSDGTKTIAKATGCDEYEPMRGVMTCAMRKVGRNRVRTESWDDVIAFLADGVADADECRVLADMLNAAADAFETGDTMQRIVEWDAEHADDKTDDGTDELEQEPLFFGTDGTNRVSFVTAKSVEEGKKREHERARALIRDLIDKGEL